MTNLDQKIKKVITCKAPLELEEIKSFFDDPSVVFHIDYSASSIKGNVFLTYLSNLDIPAEVLLDNSSPQEKEELLNSYLSSKLIVNLPSFALNVSQIILEAAGVDCAYRIINPIWNLEQRKALISKLNSQIERWITFLSSSSIYMLTSCKELEEEYNFKSHYRCVEDIDFVGYNVVNMFSVPAFTEFLFSVPCKGEILYFKHQFEDYMFKGNNIFHYFCTPENTMHIIFEEMLKGSITTDLLASLMQSQDHLPQR